MFYRLAHPDYATDRDNDKENPFDLMDDHYMIPCMECPICGKWGSHPPRRIRVDVPADERIQAMLRSDPRRWLAPADWQRTATAIADLLGIDHAEVRPGIAIGHLHIALTAYPRHDILFSWYSGLILVSERGRHALTEAGITGVAFDEVQVRWAARKRIKEPSTLPRLWELVVTGRAKLKEEWQGLVTFCDVCGRKASTDYDRLSPDTLDWDGSDVFVLNLNPAIVYVTERVCKLLEQQAFTNFACKPFMLGRR